MRREDLSRLEFAVREANPVPQPHTLVDSDEAAAVAVLIQQGRQTGTPIPQTAPPVAPARRVQHWRMKPAVVFTAACLLVLGVIGLVVLLNNGQPEFMEEPAPTTTTAPLPAGSAA
ncbi:MAG: hypothetical protein OEM84_12900 [Acidimicrobiia bacterium]|nr:hypothetical protein [Acidimicrobiia bacterium]